MSQVSFDDTMEKLAELEQFAENYAGNTQGADAKALASCYLFSDRYSGGLWEKVGIRKDADFERYVKEQDAGLSSLKEVETLSVPAGYEVDFLHMAASLYVGDDAGGWIGDLTEFAWELKNNGITEKENAAARFLSADSYWNEADFYADIDAANMRKTYQRNTLSETLLTYYGKDTDSAEEHLGQFVSDRFFADSKEELEQAVFTQVAAFCGLKKKGKKAPDTVLFCDRFSLCYILQRRGIFMVSTGFFKKSGCNFPKIRYNRVTPCGYSSLVERQLPKLDRRVRFPLPAPQKRQPRAVFFYTLPRGEKNGKGAVLRLAEH